jgi:hypothetical protein
MTLLTTTAKDSYEYYKTKTKRPVSQIVYNKINWKLNQEVIDHLILGGGRDFYFGGRLGRMVILKVIRKIRLDSQGKLKTPIDYGTTNKLRKEGVIGPTKHIYFTDNFFVGYMWRRPNCNIKGHSGYKLKSSRTNGYESTSGANNKLRRVMKSDPLYHFKFPIGVKEKKK